MSFYLKDRCLAFDYNWFAEHTRVVSDREVPVGGSIVGVRFTRIDQGGEATLLIDGEEVGTAVIPRILRMISSTGLDVGRDGLSGVCDDYQAPFAFTGRIAQVVFEFPPRASAAQRREDQETLARTELGRE